MATYEKALFGLDNWEPTYGGFTAGQHWNGWACPYFEKAVAEKILTDYVAADENYTWWYTESNDTYYLRNNENPELSDTWWAQHIKVNGVELTVYPIGAQCWIWDQVNEDDKMSVYECPNCFSDMTTRQFTIRGTIRKPSLSNTIELLDHTIEKYMFSECEECGHRWEEAK